jgi:hypothetical protein
MELTHQGCCDLRLIPERGRNRVRPEIRAMHNAGITTQDPMNIARIAIYGLTPAMQTIAQVMIHGALPPRGLPNDAGVRGARACGVDCMGEERGSPFILAIPLPEHTLRAQ